MIVLYSIKCEGKEGSRAVRFEAVTDAPPSGKHMDRWQAEFGAGPSRKIISVKEDAGRHVTVWESLATAGMAGANR